MLVKSVKGNHYEEYFRMGVKKTQCHGSQRVVGPRVEGGNASLSMWDKVERVELRGEGGYSPKACRFLLLKGGELGTRSVLSQLPA